MKKYMFILIFGLCGIITHADIRNFYHRIDVASGNVYPFVLSNLITSYANYFTHDILFDNSFEYSYISAENISIKPQNLMGITARDIFNDISAGAKLGYKSDYANSFNWSIYGCAQYKLNQFRLQEDTKSSDWHHERIAYMRAGLGFYMLFGSIEQKTKFQIDFNAKYSIPVAYTGHWGKDKNLLNQGLTTYYAIKIGGSHGFAGGIFLEMNHFNVYKQSVTKSSRMYSFGLTLTITPRRGESIYD